MWACMSAKSSTAISAARTGSISPWGGRAAKGASRIASMCNSIDREFLASSEFRSGLDAAGRRYLVSTGRYALRGIGRAQDLYTLDPDMGGNDAMMGGYERYLKS